MPIASLANLDTLIIVCGHAVYTAEDFAAVASDASWFLQRYQRGKDEPPLYIEHIRQGVDLANGISTALLVFSGGQTRAAAGPRSESQSYWFVADHHNWWGREAVRGRATTEEFACESMHNLLYGICRFLECVGKPPSSVKVLSFEFKRQRFDVHRQAVGLTTRQFEFVGVNDPTDLDDEIDDRKNPGTKTTRRMMEIRQTADYQELLDAATPFGESFGKSERRNPFARQHGYGVSCKRPEWFPEQWWAKLMNVENTT